MTAIEDLPEALNTIKQVLGRDTAEVVEVILRGGTIPDVIATIRRQVQGEEIGERFGV